MIHDHYPMLLPEARLLFVHEARKLIRLADSPPQCEGNLEFVHALRDALRKLDGPTGGVVLTSEELHAVRITVQVARGYGPAITRCLDRFWEALVSDHPAASGHLPARRAV